MSGSSSSGEDSVPACSHGASVRSCSSVAASCRRLPRASFQARCAPPLWARSPVGDGLRLLTSKVVRAPRARWWACRCARHCDTVRVLGEPPRPGLCCTVFPRAKKKRMSRVPSQDFDDRWAPDHAAILSTKIARPPVQADCVARSRLVRRLQESQAPVIALAAPAGYGKTTLLGEWADCDPRPFAWLSLDAGDDEPALLLHAIAVALEHAGPAGRRRRGRSESRRLSGRGAGPVGDGTARAPPFRTSSSSMTSI